MWKYIKEENVGNDSRCRNQIIRLLRHHEDIHEHEYNDAEKQDRHNYPGIKVLPLDFDHQLRLFVLRYSCFEISQSGGTTSYCKFTINFMMLTDCIIELWCMWWAKRHASNHDISWGMIGLIETIIILRSAGITPTRPGSSFFHV